MVQTKTDNSFIKLKIDLRISHLPSGDLRVLDCFAGSGKIWRSIKKRTGRNIKILPIDLRKDIGFHLSGDNLDYLISLDLTKFEVVDLDAYGVPVEQLKVLFDSGYKGTVFVTMIQSIFGRMPNDLLIQVGFTEEMINKTPTLFGRRGWEYFKQYLSGNGVQKIWHYSKDDKHYLCFNVE